MAFVMRLDPQENITLPTPQQFKIPALSFLISIDGIAPSLRDSLVKMPFFAARTEGTLEIFEFRQALPFKGIQPVIVIDGSTLLIATSPQFLGECRAATDRLSGNPEFQTALKHVPSEGNGLLYFSPKLFSRLADIEGMNPNLPPESARAIGMFMRQMPQTDRPLISVRSNLPDGLLIESYWNRSMKQDVAGLAVYNPVTVGLLAAMAIPAFNKVRQTSQQKAVLNNLRQLSGAAEQFFMETGRKSATYNDLVGPNKYISELRQIAGEDYRSLQFRPGATLKVRLASGQEVTFEQ
jgi:type IV pilus assembly protein PilA